jgi:hypothetical protein
MGNAMRRRRSEKAATRERAARRVEAAWACVNTLCPDLPQQDRKERARKILDLTREGYQPQPPIQITPAQVEEIVWGNSQCANRYCSMVLFSREIAEELNEFFVQPPKAQ